MHGEDQLRYSLRFLSGKSQGSEYVLADPMEIVVGRSSDADMILMEGMVSRRHARFRLRNRELIVEDLGSTNGTFVNGEKVRRRRLVEGDRVLVGTSIVKVVFSQAPLGTKPPPPKIDATDDVATADRHAMAGELDEVGVPELVEMFGTARQRIVLELGGPDGLAAVTIADGKVLDCRIVRLERAPALKCMLRVLGYHKGQFAVRPFKQPDEIRLGMPVPELLVDGLFKVDELTVIRQRLPQKGEKLVMARPLLAPLSRLDERDLEVLQLAHNAGDVDAVLDQSSEIDLETAKRLLALIDGGFLRRA
jgi:hypothetical protein